MIDVLVAIPMSIYPNGHVEYFAVKDIKLQALPRKGEILLFRGTDTDETKVELIRHFDDGVIELTLTELCCNDEKQLKESEIEFQESGFQIHDIDAWYCKDFINAKA